jgi:hypothetical protein
MTEMAKKLIATASLTCAFTLAAGLLSAAPAAAAAPPSPGACNMLNANAQGLEGMDGSGLGPGQGSGLENMMALVGASFAAGCQA